MIRADITIAEKLGIRLCTKCGRWQSSGRFYVYPNGKVRTVCRECEAKTKRKWRVHRGEIVAYAAAPAKPYYDQFHQRSCPNCPFLRYCEFLEPRYRGELMCERSDVDCGIPPEPTEDDYWLSQTHDPLRPEDDPLYGMESAMPKKRLTAQELGRHKRRWTGTRIQGLQKDADCP